MDTLAFLRWSAHRLWKLLAGGIGLASTLATVALFVLPSFASGLPRWVALVPVTGYVVYALLRDEYERVSTPCLTAQVALRDREGRSFPDWRLEIRNCGCVPIYQLEWELADEGWEAPASGIEYPIAELAPGNSKFLHLFRVLNAPVETRVRLKGFANDAPYKIEKLISVYG